MASGIGIELEEMSMVALMAALLLPGVVWLSKAKTGPAMLERAVVVGVLLVGAAVLEGKLDQTANQVTA